MTSKPRRKQRQKARLFKEQNGRCYWCNCELFLTKEHVIHQPPNLATIDHLDSRLSPFRGSYGHLTIRRRVLACHECNHRRGYIEYESRRQGVEPEVLAPPEEVAMLGLSDNGMRCTSSEDISAKGNGNKDWGPMGGALVSLMSRISARDRG